MIQIFIEKILYFIILYLYICIILYYYISSGPGTQDKWAQKELRAMASDPDDSNLYNLDDFSGLQNIMTSLLTTVCNSELPSPLQLSSSIYISPIRYHSSLARPSLDAIASHLDDSGLCNLDDLSGFQNITTSLLTTVCNIEWNLCKNLLISQWE